MGTFGTIVLLSKNGWLNPKKKRKFKMKKEELKYQFLWRSFSYTKLLSLPKGLGDFF